MTDPLRERLGRLDPMHPGMSTDSRTTQSSRQLLEDVMSTPVVEEKPAKDTRPRGWLMGVSAAAALVVVVGAVAVLTGNDPVATEPPLVLEAGGEDPTAICIQFSVDELARAPLALEGTVTGVDGETVTMTVDRWFKGGDRAVVELHAPAGMEALIGGIPFEEGGQYLITAYDGNVNYCGFSGPATPELRSAFEQAFGA